MTEAQKDEILNLLSVDLGLTRIRPATDESIEPINDNNDPDVTDLTFSDFSRENNSAFVTLSSQIFPMEVESWMNESGYKRGGIWSGEYIRDVIKILDPKLAAENFATKIIVPDDFSAIEALSRLQIIMADTEAWQYVGTFGYHLYGGSNATKRSIKNMSLLYNIPVWMTEWSTPTWLSAAQSAQIKR